MSGPHFIVVSGCNASGKTSFINKSVAKLQDYVVIIPDQLGSQTIPLLEKSITQRKNIREYFL